MDCCGIAAGFIPISHLTEEGRGINPARLLAVLPVKMIEKRTGASAAWCFPLKRACWRRSSLRVGSRPHKRVNEGCAEGREQHHLFGVFAGNLGALEVWSTSASFPGSATPGPRDLVR